MSKGKNPAALSGRIGGLAVKNMIEAVEEKMAHGETVSAAPASEAEAQLLQEVQQENQQSARRARQTPQG